ncbi:MAG: HAMP domain-containing methyl-accepting chemotaxis protein [Spirochaetota bacterium]
MARMKMRTKILIGFASVLALLAVVGVVSVTYLQQANNGFTQYRDWARDSNLVAEMNESLLMARMNVKDYIIRGTAQEQQEFQAYFDELREFVDDAHAEITATGRAEKVAEIDSESMNYQSSFDQVVGFQKVRDDSVEIMNQTGPEIERSLTNVLVGAREDGAMEAAYQSSLAMRNLLLARLYAMRFLDDNSQASEDRVLQELSELRQNLALLDAEIDNAARQAVVNEIAPQVERYQNAFTATVDAIYARNDQIDNHLDVIGPQIADLADEIMLSVIADQDTLGPQLQASLNMANLVVIVVAIAAVLIGILLAILISGGILKQLGEDPALIEQIAQRVAQGDLEINTDHEAIGVYKSVQEMVRALRYKANVVEQIAQRDLTVDIKKASDKDSLGESLIVMRDALHDLLSQTRVAIEQVAAGSGQVSSASQELSQGATEQASSLEEVSSSVNEINGQSRQNADNSTEANNIARQAAQNARSGNEQMSQLREAMGNISHSSEEIKKVVKVIDDIAFQINLLALNANVEAARAGKYGKGFAVVAEEVRNLAVRSADAVQETTAMVEESVRNIESGNELTDLTAKQLEEIVTGADRVAEFLEEISAASKEQAQAIDQITEGLGQIDQVTQSNTASAEESASAAEELASQAEQLRASIADFKLHDAGEGRYLGAPAASSGSVRRVASSTGKGHERQRVPAGVHAGNGHAAGNGRASGNGSGHAPEGRPEDVIKLDDDEFDRF